MRGQLNSIRNRYNILSNPFVVMSIGICIGQRNANGELLLGILDYIPVVIFLYF